MAEEGEGSFSVIRHGEGVIRKKKPESKNNINIHELEARAAIVIRLYQDDDVSIMSCMRNYQQQFR